MKRSRDEKKEQKIFLGLLRELREKAGLTQVELAKMLREQQSFVSKYELGERRLDFVETRRIVNALGLTVAQFSKTFEEMLKQDEH